MQNIILVGFGFMGTTHAQVYAQLQAARVVAVVDTQSSAARQSMAALEIGTPLFETLDEAFDAVDADVVDICLPTDLHAEYAVRAAGAGKHLFCEKPLALAQSDAKKIADAAEQAGVAAQVGQCIRFWPEYMAFREFVNSGKAGALLSLTLQRRSMIPQHSVGGWMLEPMRSGGAAVDLHIHDTDFLVSLLGTPRRVSSQAVVDRNGPSHIFTTYHYEGLVVQAEGGWNYPKKWGFQMAFQAVFENGAVEYDSGASPSLTVTGGRGGKKPLAFKNPAIGKSTTGAGNISSLGGYFNELQYFITCLERDVAPATATPRQAAESLRVVLAEVRSAQTGKTIKL